MEAKAAVLVGREGKFSAGFDLTTMTAGPEQAVGLLKAGIEFAHPCTSSPIPVVIAATGHGLAMGAILLKWPPTSASAPRARTRSG